MIRPIRSAARISASTGISTVAHRDAGPGTHLRTAGPQVPEQHIGVAVRVGVGAAQHHMVARQVFTVDFGDLHVGQSVQNRQHLARAGRQHAGAADGVALRVGGQYSRARKSNATSLTMSTSCDCPRHSRNRGTPASRVIRCALVLMSLPPIDDKVDAALQPEHQDSPRLGVARCGCAVRRRCRRPMRRPTSRKARRRATRPSLQASRTQTAGAGDASSTPPARWRCRRHAAPTRAAARCRARPWPTAPGHRR